MSEKPTYEELEQRIQEFEQSESERKQTEKELQKSRERYRWIFENLQDVYYEAAADGTILEVSPSIEKISQYTRKVLIGKSLYDIYTDSKERDEFVKILLDKGKVNDYEINLKDIDGSQRLCSITALLTRDSQGIPIKIIGSMRDISKRKQAEKALKESEERFRQAFLTSPDSINLNRLEDGIYIDINDGFTTIMGYTREEVVGKSSLSLNIWGNPEDRKRLVDGLTKKGYVENMEAPFVGKDGKIRYGLMSARVTKISGENVIISITRDITERKQSEEAVRESENKFRNIFNLSSQAIALTEVETGKIVEVNQIFCELTQYSEREIVGKTTTELRFYSDKDRIRFIDRVKASGRVHGLEMNFRAKDGSKLTALMFANLIEISERHLILTMFYDITEQKKLENQLRQSQKMESIGTLAGGIAHDFNNILAIIIGNTEMAIDAVPEWNLVKEYLKEIQTAGARAKDVVRHILNFSRKDNTDRKPTNMRLIVEDTLEMLRSSIPTDIEIRQNISCESDMILADPTQMSQVLMNLCTNSTHAMRDEGGILEISLQNVEFGKQNMELDLGPGRYVKLALSDTGYGIDPKHIDRIFDPYFTTKVMGEGTGLGLSVIQGIVKTHHGAVTVKSEPGKGTVFEVLFPVIEGEMEPEAEGPRVFLIGKEKILFIDDEESILKLVKKRLEMQGYQVEAKNNPVEALELFRSEPDRFDLIITDMTMPKMTGDKLAKEILGIRPEIPIILCSGYSDRIDAEKATAMGIRKYIEKPLDMSDFMISIRKVLDESKNSAQG